MTLDAMILVIQTAPLVLHTLTSNRLIVCVCLLSVEPNLYSTLMVTLEIELIAEEPGSGSVKMAGY